ncbi:MAG: hypothetical protein GY751_08395 [Bacteroidetes bacterium]|nr:hypothetical protein [Bacteroidota bacterium]
MNYYDFIRDLPTQEDDNLNQVIDIILKDTSFPKTDDLEKLAEHLYLKLNPDLTTAFQRSLMLWQFALNDYKQPQDVGLLNQINYIVDLQNNDPDYSRSGTAGQIPEANRPLKVVCCIPIEFPTRDDGDVYVFVAKDIYSQFVFNTGVEKSNSGEMMVKHIKQLLEYSDFKKQLGKPFTLVLHKYWDFQEEIQKVINPHKGNLVIDDTHCYQHMTSLIKHMYKTLGK